VQGRLVTVHAEEPERGADHLVVDVRRGRETSGVADGPQQLDGDHRLRRPPDLVEQVDRPGELGRLVDRLDGHIRSIGGHVERIVHGGIGTHPEDAVGRLTGCR
jgi:hypothetical protein